MFRVAGSGFDAILGNPPWDIAKPNSKEFFSNIDPLYRSYGKQEALRYQTDYFTDEEIERTWLDYSADFRAQSNFIGTAASPSATRRRERATIVRDARGRENGALHARWREARPRARGFADPRTLPSSGIRRPQSLQGLPRAGARLLRTGGRLGFIVRPASTRTMAPGGCAQLFLDRCRWEWLFGFENRDGIFASICRFKFNPVIVEKGARPRRSRPPSCATGSRTGSTPSRSRRPTPAPGRALQPALEGHPRDPVPARPRDSREDLRELGAPRRRRPGGWGIKYATEFHMTNDSKLFPPRPKWEADGYRPDEYSRWLKGDWHPIAELWARAEGRSVEGRADRFRVRAADGGAGRAEDGPARAAALRAAAPRPAADSARGYSGGYHSVARG